MNKALKMDIVFPVCVKYKVSGNPPRSIPETTPNVFHLIGKHYIKKSRKIGGVKFSKILEAHITEN